VIRNYDIPQGSVVQLSLKIKPKWYVIIPFYRQKLSFPWKKESPMMFMHCPRVKSRAADLFHLFLPFSELLRPILHFSAALCARSQIECARSHCLGRKHVAPF